MDADPRPFASLTPRQLLAVLRVYTPPPRAVEDAITDASRTRLTWTPSHLFLHVDGGLEAV